MPMGAKNHAINSSVSLCLRRKESGRVAAIYWARVRLPLFLVSDVFGCDEADFLVMFGSILHSETEHTF